VGLTDWIILGTIAAIAVSDVALMRRGIPTYSNRLKAWGSRLSFFPYAWGVLGGHFWSPLEPVVSWQVTIAVLPTIGIALSLTHLLLRKPGWGWVKWLPLLAYFPAGVPVGAILWAQGS